MLMVIFTDHTVLEKDILNDSLKTINEYKLNSFISGFTIDQQGNKWFSLLHEGVVMYPKIRIE
jgi:hypothetical protein